MKHLYRYLIPVFILSCTCIAVGMTRGRYTRSKSTTSFVWTKDTVTSLVQQYKKKNSPPKRAITKDKNSLKSPSLKKSALDSVALKALARKSDTSKVTRALSELLESPKDTIAPIDTLSADSIKGDLKAPLDFQSNDSIVILPRSNFVKMYGKAEVKYQTQDLSGDYMHMQTDSGILYATYIDYPDSIDKEKLYAKIKNGEQEQYEAKSIHYNIKTSKGYITDVITQQGDGYITAERTKRMNNSDLYMEDGKYTTCSNHEHPHFYIALTKAKVRPQKDLVSGPLYLVFADVPIPVGLPFAFFPFTTSRASGLIMPTYGEEGDRGFYLRNGGYYFAINDYVDLQLTGDIYTKGSWGVNGSSTYRKRYSYSGNVNASYLITKRGDKTAGDYSEARDFRIAWTHRQDDKANPYRNFSANVNFSTSSYNHNDLNALYNQAIMGQNTKSSSISFSQRFPNSPWSISGSFDIAQRSKDSTVNVTLPNLSITMSRIYPFKRKKQVGGDRWYEKISLSYSGQLRNSVETKESKLFKTSFFREWQNGMTHSIPVSASFDLFDYFKITPSIQYTERWFTRKVRQAYDPELNRVAPVDTMSGFYRVYDFSTSLSLSTTVYGFFKPLSFLGDYVNMIRHRMEPSISVNYRPDFGDAKYGYWETLNYISKNGRKINTVYSPFGRQIFGVPGRGESGSISLSVSNNLEAKVKDSADSLDFKKISLIENLSLSTGYNLAADSFQWSDFSASLSLRLTKDFTFRLGGAFEPYIYDYHEHDGRIVPYRVNKLRVFNGRGLGRFRGTGTSFSYTLNTENVQKILSMVGIGNKEKKEKDRKTSNFKELDDAAYGPPEGPEHSSSASGGSLFNENSKNGIKYDVYGYSENVIDWSIGFNYNLSLGWGDFDPAIKEYRYKLRHDLSFSGHLNFTRNWRFNFSANYNFDQRKITNISCNLSRDLHCWSMIASFIPIGPYKSYNFTVAVKSELLKDLKYRKNSHPSYTRQWY